MWYYYYRAECSRKCLFNAIIWIHGHDNVQMGILLFLLEPVMYADHVLFSTSDVPDNLFEFVITHLLWASFNSHYSLSLPSSLSISLSLYRSPLLLVEINSQPDSLHFCGHTFRRRNSLQSRLTTGFTLLLSLWLLCMVKCFKDRVLGWKHELHR